MDKNPHAQALGKIGGLNSAKGMTPEERTKRAKKAVTVREFNRAVKAHEAYSQEGKESLDWYQWTPLRVKIAKLGHELGMKNKELAALLECSVPRIHGLRLYDGNDMTNDTRKYVKDREGNKCGHCKVCAPLQVHHIFESNNHDPSNLIALCVPCHNKADEDRRVNFLKTKPKKHENNNSTPST